MMKEWMWSEITRFRPSKSMKFWQGVSRRWPMSSLPKTLESLLRSARSPCPLASFLTAAVVTVLSREPRAVEAVSSLAMEMEGTLEKITAIVRARQGSKLLVSIADRIEPEEEAAFSSAQVLRKSFCGVDKLNGKQGSNESSIRRSAGPLNFRILLRIFGLSSSLGPQGICSSWCEVQSAMCAFGAEPGAALLVPFMGICEARDTGPRRARASVKSSSNSGVSVLLSFGSGISDFMLPAIQRQSWIGRKIITQSVLKKRS